MADTKTTDKNTKQGQGWHGDSAGHARAGKQGGDKVAAERGSSYYEKIGHDGGLKSSGSFEKGSQRAKEAGKKGGQNSHGAHNQNS